jgi:hypothetical protein
MPIDARFRPLVAAFGKSVSATRDITLREAARQLGITQPCV